MAQPDPPKTIPVHRIDLPRIVLVGKGVLFSLNGICRELGYCKALIVTGKNTLKIAGEKVQWILANDGIGSDRSIVEDAQLETVGRVMEDTGRTNADVLIGVGGGRSIDVAKLAAAKTGKAFISVPTVASHDGIASSLVSVKGMDRPYTVKAVPPIAVVMDSGIIAASPYRFTAAGCGDVISKITEVEDWRLANADHGDYYGAYAASLALMSSQLVMESAERIRQNTSETVRDLLEALISCSTSMSIAGSSRPCSGSAHLFSHALDLIIDKPALHGEQCGVGAIMMARLHGLGWRSIKESLEKIGAPTTAAALGIKREKIIEALVIAQSIRPDRYTILSKITLDRVSAEALAVETGVI